MLLVVFLLAEHLAVAVLQVLVVVGQVVLDMKIQEEYFFQIHFLIK